MKVGGKPDTRDLVTEEEKGEQKGLPVKRGLRILLPHVVEGLRDGVEVRAEFGDGNTVGC